MSETIEASATRRGRNWVVHLREHGVYAHGRTLALARENTMRGLELVGVTAEVTLTPVTPELERLRAAEDVYAAALGEAVAALALRRTTLRDIAQATGVPTTRVKPLLPARSAPPADLNPGASTSPAAGRTSEHEESGHPPSSDRYVRP